MRPRYSIGDFIIDEHGHAKKRVLGSTEGRTRSDSAKDFARHGKQVSNPAPAPAYKSKLEAEYANDLMLQQRTGMIKAWWYEPFSFKLANGKRYRVDFMVWLLDGTTECHEIKGVHQNMRDSLTHLAWAAQKFPFHTWKLCKKWPDRSWSSRIVGAL